MTDLLYYGLIPLREEDNSSKYIHDTSNQIFTASKLNAFHYNHCGSYNNIPEIA